MKMSDYDKASFFVGGEAEHTPAFSRKTLFVVGKQQIEQILLLARENKVTHISLGINNSVTEGDLYHQVAYWNKTITSLLSSGFMVTLNYKSQYHKDMLLLLENEVWQSRSFIPLLAIQIPSIEDSSVNLTIKIDDSGVNATNPGVWCMHFKEVTDSNRFTSWDELAVDKYIDSVGDVIVEAPTALNNAEAGLDRITTTALNPEITVPETLPAPKPVKSIKTVAAAADAYTEGTIKDPLSSKSKPISAKK